ncbi:MAG: hypothetical protein AB7V50_01860 [Vampirovibrionia bacterium]
MSEVTVQDLLQLFVANNGGGVDAADVEPFLNDPDSLNRRIAYELMHNITGDARYLIKCLDVIKDDVEVLWEFLFDYTSELKDPYVITILMMEGLRHLDAIKDSDKAEKVIYNWRILNPFFEKLPDNEETALKIKNIYQLSLPLIANTFVNWMLAGIKYKEFYEFDYFSYYLLNHAKLKYTFPDYVFKAVESIDEKYLVDFNKAILYVFQYDVVSANESFISAAKELISLNDVVQAYNVVTLWYQSAGFMLDTMPELLKALQDIVYLIAQKAYELYSDKSEIVIMTTYFYAEIATVLYNTNKLDVDVLLQLSKKFEDTIISYKKSSNIDYKFNSSVDKPLNIGFMSQFISRHAVNSTVFDFIKHCDRDKFNVFYYDCGMNAEISSAYLDEFSQYSTIRSYNNKYKGDKFKNIVDLANQINKDKIDILIYTDWLYNIVGHAVCALKPAPVIVSANGDGVPTGLESIDYTLDYSSILASEQIIGSDKAVPYPFLYAELAEDQPEASREIFEVPENKVLLYASNYIKNIVDYRFMNVIARLLVDNPECHFVFSGPGDPDVVFNFLDDRALFDRATYLGDLPTVENFMSFVKMSDIYLNTTSSSNISEIYAAMVASVPVVTLHDSSQGYRSLLGSYIVKDDTLIAHSFDEYIEIANNLIKSDDLRTASGKALKVIFDSEYLFDKALRNAELALISLTSKN